MKRRSFVQTALAVCSGMAMPAIVRAQSAASQPLRIVVPFSAGGGMDAIARMLGNAFQGSAGRPVVIENRPGAEGRIGLRAVASSPTDGSMLVLAPTSLFAVFPSIAENLGYDAFKDFVAVTQVARYEFALAAAPTVPAENAKEAAKWLRDNPGKATFGVTSITGIPYFTARMFADAEKIDGRFIVYRGAGQLITSLIGGHITFAVTTDYDIRELTREGKVKALATSGRSRSQLLPNVPTYKELGYDIEADSWFALFAPSGTPDNIVKQYSEIFVKAIRSDSGREFFHSMGLEPTGTSPKEAADILLADFHHWAGAIKRLAAPANP